MRRLGFLLALVIGLLLYGCEQKPPDVTTPAPEVAAQPGGVLSGETLFLACVACHSLAEGRDHRVGPNLFGIAGQAAASRPGYSYSEALQNSGIVWNTGTLIAWIMQTEGMVPGTWMAYSNYLDGAEVQRLVDYILQQNTTHPE